MFNCTADAILGSYLGRCAVSLVGLPNTAPYFLRYRWNNCDNSMEVGIY
jgi:hypothetical protein